MIDKMIKSLLTIVFAVLCGVCRQHRRWLVEFALRSQSPVSGIGSASQARGSTLAHSCCSIMRALCTDLLQRELRFTYRVLTTLDVRSTTVAGDETISEQSDRVPSQSHNWFAPSEAVVRSSLLADSELFDWSGRVTNHLRVLLPTIASELVSSLASNDSSGPQIGTHDGAADCSGSNVKNTDANTNNTDDDDDGVESIGGDEADIDAKNYHAWAHRQWALAALGPRCAPSTSYDGSAAVGASVCCRCSQPLPLVPPPPTQLCASAFWPPSLLAHELRFTRALLERDDVRNNSAWNHRFFVLNRGAGLAVPLADDTVSGGASWQSLSAPAAAADALLPAEVASALSSLTPGLGPSRNESAWSHLRGVLTLWARRWRRSISGTSGPPVADAPRGTSALAVHLASVHTAFPSLLPTLLAIRCDADPAVNVGANETLAMLLEWQIAAAVAPDGPRSSAPASSSKEALPPDLTSQLSLLSPSVLYSEIGECDMGREPFWLQWKQAGAT